MKILYLLKQKARNGLVLFVFACILIITGLLYIVQKAEATRDHVYGTSNTYAGYLD